MDCSGPWHPQGRLLSLGRCIFGHFVTVQILTLHFGSVLEGSGPRKGFQKVGEAYSKILAKDGL